ncbi:primase-like DNA-binding domain-containing protein [Streptomyces sp. NPDC017940]|uniref:primase-like DNA-binding domain-containing protein n=1 Tax=Streptomyces sp. NPDC017940 TaxID=3365017 RepID=UPI0037B20C10
MDRLIAELPGILNWALDGLARLQRTGRITEPAASRDAVATMQDTASPTTAFIRERCTTGPAYSIPVDNLWAIWREWAEDNGVKPGSKQVFGRDLQSAIPQLSVSRPRDGETRIRIYTGITVRPAPGADG